MSIESCAYSGTQSSNRCCILDIVVGDNLISLTLDLYQA